MRGPGATLVALLLFLAHGPAMGQPSGTAAHRLHEADLALLDLDLETACAIWYESLPAPRPVRDVALYRLAQWIEHCPRPDDAMAATQLADAFPQPANQVWRAWDFAALLLERVGQMKQALRYTSRVLEPQSRGWLPVTAPTLWAFATTNWPEEGAPGEGIGSGGLAWTHSCFSAPEARSVALRLTFPNPGRALLDGEELAVVGPDTGRSFPVTYLTTVRLRAGAHDLRILQGVTSALNEVRVEFVPPEAAHGSRCDNAEPSGWSRQPSPPDTATAAELAPWVKLAHGQATDEDIREWAASALGSPEAYLLYRSALHDRALAIPRSEDLARELSASILVNLEACLPRLDLADSYLSGGEREAARQLLERSDAACLDTARGLLLQAEVALWMQWDALSDRFLHAAHDRYPQNCFVQDRWNERQRELGRPIDSSGVVCRATRRGLELDSLRRGDPVDIPGPEQFVEAWNEASGPLRERLVPTIAAALDDPLWQPVTDELIRTDPQLAWMLADHFLAAQEPELAERFATRASEHRNTWESLRTQAGRVFHWSNLLPRLVALEPIIDGYIDDGFAAGSAQVVVLDEAVAKPGANGWLTLAETTILHVTSPDAAEAIGEVSIGPDEELLELAVRKADGRWFGPSNRGEPGFKETFSLAGLAPGDFIVRRTIREVQLQGGAGSCHVLPAFYFTPREAPVYISRYVLMADADGWEITTVGDLDVVRSEGRFVAEKRRLEPVPAEPRCPDPAAGLEWLRARRPCASWDRVRDRVGDALLGYCNGRFQPASEQTAEEVYRRIMTTVEGDGSSLFDASERDILERGRGNRTLALYCALVQAGFEAHLVATHSPGAPAIDWRRPSLSPFDGMLVFVAGAGHWFDPYDQLVEPGYVRPVLRGRTGMVLTPRFPRLFLRTEDGPRREGWKIELDGALDSDGGLRGELAIEASGDAAVTLDRQVRNQGEEARQRMAESLLYMMLPGVSVTAVNYQVEGGRVKLDLEFEGRIEVADEGRLLLRLPPAPAQELVQLAHRSSALYFGGMLPTEIFVTLGIDRDLVWSVPTGVQGEDDAFSELDLTVEARSRSLHVHKRVHAPPRRVDPEDYGAFVQSVIRLRRLELLPIEVRYDGNR